MSRRPHVLLSSAVSVDGYIDDCADRRLILSNEADLDRVDEVRAGSDAILVGAATVRRDDPRLLVRSAERVRRRVERGEPAQPAKVTLTSRGGLDPGSRFFTAGEGVKLVYTASRAASGLRSALAGRASVVDLGPAVALPELLADLARRGVRRLMVEGGGRVHTQFLTAGLVDELHLVVAPLFVGAADAPRFVHPGAFPHGGDHRMELAEVRRIGDVVLLVYRLGGGTGG